MIKLLLLFSTLSFGQYICVNNSGGDIPLIKFRGDTHQSTYEKAVRLCMSFRTQQYVTFRNRNPSPERLIVFMEDCVNKTFCLEKERVHKNEN
jgi:hypothetical protein